MLTRALLAISLLAILSVPAQARTSSSEASLARAFPQPPIHALAGVVMDASNGKVLASQNPHRHLPMASTTKIMTAVLALQLGNLSDKIKVPKAAFNYDPGATVMGLHPGQTVTLRDLLYGLLLPSGADAANTIAIHYGGSEKKFVGMMNAEAKQLNLADTHYADPSGLETTNHHSSAYDLAVLGQYASYNADLMGIVSTKYHTWNGQTLTNLNKPLYWYPGVDGIKPGWIPESGLCQVLDARRHNRHVVVTLLNTPDLDTDARDLLNFGLRDFTWTQSQLPHDTPAGTQSGADAGGTYLYFPASGHFLHGKFLTTFRADGGLATLGFPRTEPLQEGKLRVQYFQNGALAMNGASRVYRLSLGSLVSLPAAPTPTATPTPSPTPIPTPHEGTVTLATPVTSPTPTPRPHRTPTPTPKPTPPIPPVVTTGKMFASFQKSHSSLLGGPVSTLRQNHGYSFQVFAYGALVYDPGGHAVYRLPLGDYLLTSRHFLPDHPGNAYPDGFAPVTVLKSIGWLPTGISSTVRAGV